MDKKENKDISENIKEVIDNSRFVVEYHFDGCKGCPYLIDNVDNEDKIEGYGCDCEYVFLNNFSWFPYDNFLDYESKVMDCCKLKEKPIREKKRKWFTVENSIISNEE